MSSPPTGTVTFLFTDIQGSTRLWEAHPEAMRPALVRHDALLRQAIEAHEGYVFKTIGDAFCAAFATAPDALAAAKAAQCALVAEDWPEHVPLQVRMALHTGAADERGGDYFGPPLNRVARLMAAGHGGQVLLSEVTQGLVRDVLPPDVTLRNLGEQRLRDLGRPENVFQLLCPALPTDFPPLRSLDNPDLPNNLPTQPTSFIGREKEVARIKALLTQTHLLTLTGSGGSGKTRLSLQVAADLLDDEADGVWLVELASLFDPALVPQAIADVLGVREEAGRPIRQTLVDWLRPKRLLLVLDNCEHLLSACAALASDLLRHCPQVHILASSREPLGVAGEQVYRVPRLTLPDPKQTQTVEALSQYEAVALFIQRAKAVQPSFAVTDANAPAVAQVCFHLDGIPLAIELAAARVRAMPVEQVMARLGDRFRLLTGGSRTALPRQQTLRALLDWSYDLLTEAEKTTLRRLSVFAGGWTLAAAEGVCSGDDIEEWEVLDLLTSLVDKSLVVYEEQGDGEGRYGLLETVRQYARDRLAEAGEAEAAQARAASWFLALAEEAEPQLRGPGLASWLERLETEHDNLRASLSWYEQRGDGIEASLRLAGALGLFWYVRTHYTEGRQWLGRALERTKSSEDAAVDWEASAIRARALSAAGHLAYAQSDNTAARALHEEALAVSRRAGDDAGIATALDKLGLVIAQQGDHASARALHEESLKMTRQMGDQHGMAASLNALGRAAHQQTEYVEARALYEESLTLRRLLGDQWGVSNCLNDLGNLAQDQDDDAGARALHEESIAIKRQLRDQRGIASSLNNLGNVACAQGDSAGARAFFEESATIFRQVGGRLGLATALSNLGNMACNQGDLASARALYEECLTIRRQSGAELGVAEALSHLGDFACRQSDYAEVRALYEEALLIGRRLGNHRVICASLGRLGDVAAREGDYTTALAWVEENLTISRQSGDQRFLSGSLSQKANFALRQGDLATARALADESLTLRRQLENQKGIVPVLITLADVVFAQGDLSGAAALYHESLTMQRTWRERERRPSVLNGLAGVAHAQNQTVRAVRLWGAAASLRERFWQNWTQDDQKNREELLATVREVLGKDAFAAAWDAGRAMTWEQVVDYALGGEAG